MDYLTREFGLNNHIFLTRCTSLLVLCSSFGLTSCQHQDGSAKAAAPQDSKAVQFTAVAEAPIEEQLQLSAKIQADPARSFRVFPPASGKVIGIEVKPGDIVTKGERVATIESADAGSAQSDLAKAQIEADRTQRAAERQKVLLDHGAVAEKDYSDAKAAADSAQAELSRARRHIEVLGIDTQRASDLIPLVSPGRGVVLTVGAASGEFSKSLDNADPLLTIADLSTIWIVGDVFEKDIEKVQRGTRVTVTVDAFPDKTWKGQIDSVSGALDPATRTLKVRVSLQNPGDKLKPEMFAAIYVDVGHHTAIVVPSSAVIHEGQSTVVFVENNGKPEQTNVVVGQSIDGKIEIKSGLAKGQKVAENGAELLTGGASQP